MSAVRLRRLHADAFQVQEFVRQHPRVQLIQAEGDPPERYQLRFQIRGLRQNDDQLLQVDDHLVEIALPRNYPRTPPVCRMLSPVFHPNIAPHAICIGDHWSPGEPLSAIIARIGEMIAYQSYNTKSPLNGEAARWVTEHIHELPLDPVSMMLDVAPATAPAPLEVEELPVLTVAPDDDLPVLEAVVIDNPCPRCGHEMSQGAGGLMNCRQCAHTGASFDAQYATSLGTPPTQRYADNQLDRFGVVGASARGPEGRVAPVGLANLQLPPMCPSQALWNMKCPGCGLTRAFVCLAGGDVAQAQRMHRLGVLMFMTVLLQIPYRMVALSRPEAPPLGYWFPRVFGYALITALIGNWLLEVVGYLPDELPVVR